MKVYFVEYNHYEDHDFYSGWTSRKLAESSLAKLLSLLERETIGPFWDRLNYSVVEYEVTL